MAADLYVGFRILHVALLLVAAFGRLLCAVTAFVFTPDPAVAHVQVAACVLAFLITVRFLQLLRAVPAATFCFFLYLAYHRHACWWLSPSYISCLIASRC